MYELFLKAWNDLGFSGTHPLARAYFKDLVRRYAESHRYYHDWVHIEKMLKFLTEESNSFDPDPQTVMAAFYHDAIYTVPGVEAEPEFRGMSSEEASSVLFRRHFIGLGNDAAMHRICKLISTTGDYLTKGSQNNLGDADLIGLSREGEFLSNGDLIRQEFQRVPELEFMSGRRKFYEAMLALPNIFHSPRYREHSEPVARVLMQAEVDRLKQEGYGHFHGTMHGPGDEATRCGTERFTLDSTRTSRVRIVM